jgi:hypothetical protein
MKVTQDTRPSFRRLANLYWSSEAEKSGDESSIGSQFNSTKEGPPVARKPQTVPLFLKCGDDLRQDQLIMQLMLLMDGLLKKVNLDLRLLTYHVMAFTQNDGIMEFVAGSYAVSAILANFE